MHIVFFSLLLFSKTIFSSDFTLPECKIEPHLLDLLQQRENTTSREDKDRLFEARKKYIETQALLYQTKKIFNQTIIENINQKKIEELKNELVNIEESYFNTRKRLRALELVSGNCYLEPVQSEKLKFKIYGYCQRPDFGLSQVENEKIYKQSKEFLLTPHLYARKNIGFKQIISAIGYKNTHENTFVPYKEDEIQLQNNDYILMTLESFLSLGSSTLSYQYLIKASIHENTIDHVFSLSFDQRTMPRFFQKPPIFHEKANEEQKNIIIINIIKSLQGFWCISKSGFVSYASYAEFNQAIPGLTTQSQEILADTLVDMMYKKTYNIK